MQKSCRMALKLKAILTCFLCIWLSFIKVGGFVVFDEEKRFGSFNKNARTTESFDRGVEKTKSGQQAGRLLIWQDKASNPYVDGIDGLYSDLGSHSRYGENTSDDPGWMNMQPHWGNVYGQNALNTPTVERLLGMKPTVDCVGDLMKLTVHGFEASFGSNFLIARGSSPPLPLSQLPSKCGHRFLRTWRDFVFIVPFDGCYVLQEKDAFVLPLLWWGLPVKMSCSSLSSSRRLPTVSCYTSGMIVRLHSGVSENLKIKVKNEWNPLLKVSARCGYSLVSHPEGVVIHAPYMPCTEPKDGMFTLSMATEREFNLSCPALMLNLAPKNDTSTSVPFDLILSTLPPTTVTTTETTQPVQPPTSLTIKKFPSPLLPYVKPKQPEQKPVLFRYPFIIFPSKIPPTIVPQDPKIVGPSAAVTKAPQVDVYTKRLHAWYPLFHKTHFRLTPDTSQSAAVPYYRTESLSKPTKSPDSKAPLVSLVKPTSAPPKPIVPPVESEYFFPPSNLVYPLYPGKPGFVAPSTAESSQVPSGPYRFQTRPRPPEPQRPLKPESAPPIPAPTRKTGPQLIRYPWFKPFPTHLLEVPMVPTKVPPENIVSASKVVACTSIAHSKKSEEAAKPLSACPEQSVVKSPLHFDITPITSPSHTPPLSPEVVRNPVPIKVPIAPVSSSLAQSFHCPTFCPGPPSVSYHHHNHHHFGHPFSASNFDMLSFTKITGQMQMPFSPGISTSSVLFPPVQGMGYNYGPHASKGAAIPLTSDNAAKQYLIENPSIKGTSAPDDTKLFAEPTLFPYFFRKLVPTAASPWTITNPPKFAPVIHNLEPFKVLSRPLQGSTAVPLAYSDRSPKPAVYQSEVERHIPPWGPQMAPMSVSPNNVLTEKMVQHDVSLKPAMHTADGKNVYVNYWYEATSNAKPLKSDSPTKESFSQVPLPQSSNKHSMFESSPQPEQTHGINPSMQLNFHPLMPFHSSVPEMNTQLYYPQSTESVAPVFRDSKLLNTYWVSAAQSKQDA